MGGTQRAQGEGVGGAGGTKRGEERRRGAHTVRARRAHGALRPSPRRAAPRSAAGCGEQPRFG